jgi:hypothetical protein
LSRDSKLKLRILKRDGSHWNYTCRGRGRSALNANINLLYGKGISVVVDCRVDEKAFSRAVDLDPEDVGMPNMVFHALIQDGKVSPGAQRGIFFQPADQSEASELKSYVNAGDDPNGLAVVFRSGKIGQ